MHDGPRPGQHNTLTTAREQGLPDAISQKTNLLADGPWRYPHRIGCALHAAVVFLTDGRLEMDTNSVENTIRPITLN